MMAVKHEHRQGKKAAEFGFKSNEKYKAEGYLANNMQIF